MKIERTGIYTDFSVEAYFRDPCPQPSLTQSVAKVLLEKSPLHAWHCHPRLNPDWKADDPTKFDIGNCAHSLMCGRGKQIVVLEGFDDWRKQAAKDAREAATAKGQLAVLEKHHAKAAAMVRAAREQLALRGLDHLFDDKHGHGEVVLAWDERGTWFRQLVDWLTADRCTVADYKTTDMSAAPQNLSRMMVNAGWPIQAGMAERGLDVLDPDNAGRRQYLFVVQEAEKPYALSVVEITEGPLTMGRKMLDHAATIWAHCLMHNRFPGYPTEILMPQMPSWAETQWLEREIDHDERSKRAERSSDSVWLDK